MKQHIKDLLGDPKKAIIKISVPMMLGMAFHTAYNVVDGIWVAGLGKDQLAAVGLMFPFFMVIMAMGVGIGVGGGSAVSRFIGARNKKDTDAAATHTLVIGLVIAIILGFSLLPFLNNIFLAMGKNVEVAKLATRYGTIIFMGTPVLMFSYMAGALFRAEGAAKKAMAGLIVGSLLNIVLDPIFIYGLNMGIAGAAVATVLSILVSSCFFIYWLFIEKKTHITISFKGFRFRKDIIKNILSVGVPAISAQMSMALAMGILNGIIVSAGGTDGIAVFTSGWRIVMIAVIPLLGLATGVTTVTGAGYGAKDPSKIRDAYLYAVKIGMVIELIMGILILVLAPLLAHIFTYSKASSTIYPELVYFLRINVIFYIFIPMGMLTSAMFQGIKKGFRSLAVTIVRTIGLQVAGAYVLGVVLGGGLRGIWIGMIAGNVIAAILAFAWGRYTLNHLFSDKSNF